MRTFLFILFSFWSIASYSQQEATTTSGRKVFLWEDGTWVYEDSLRGFKVKPVVVTKLELPKSKPGESIITHTGFALTYIEKHEQASWVAYELTKEETISRFERTDKFLKDPKVSTGTATDKDYAKSGYDRGHLAPAADMGWSSVTMEESFYYSNMSPQEPGFNRGIWKRLEDLMRSWAVQNEAIHIATGPVLQDGLRTIGPNGVSIPNYYYKVILDYRAPDIKGIGFIMRNMSSSGALQSYAVSIDSVENFVGIDFFPGLPDDQEELIEKNLCLKCWTWDGDQEKSGEKKASESVQCKGTTQEGNQCRNKTLDESGYCYLHVGQDPSKPQEPKVQKRTSSVQCSATTQAGSRCKRTTLSANGKCYQHGGN